MHPVGQCRVCGGVFRIDEDGSFLRPHGKQRYRCRGWKRAPVDSTPRPNVVSRFSAFGKV